VADMAQLVRMTNSRDKTKGCKKAFITIIPKENTLQTTPGIDYTLSYDRESFFGSSVVG
jgi:hypothetical protein